MKTRVIQVDGYDLHIGLIADDFVQNRASVYVTKGPDRIGLTTVVLVDDQEQIHRQAISKVRNILSGHLKFDIIYG